MANLIRLFFVVLCLTALSAGAQAPRKDIPAPQKSDSIEGVTEWRLPNGLKILTIPDPGVDTITVHIVYLVGSRHEGYGEKGMAHLLEHMLFKGSKNFADIKGELTRRGARWNGTTSNDRTNYFETVSATPENLDWALAMEADRMVNSRVSREDLDSEMTVVRNEFEMGENNPGSVLFQRMQQAAYAWHNYGNPVIGERTDIERVPVDKLHPFYSGVKSYQDLPPILTEQVAHFFQHYKDLEPRKWVKIAGWVGTREAQREIIAGVKRYVTPSNARRRE